MNDTMSPEPQDPEAGLCINAEPRAEPEPVTKKFFEMIMAGQGDELFALHVFAESADQIVDVLNWAMRGTGSRLAMLEVHDDEKGLRTVWVNPRHVVVLGRPVEPRRPALYPVAGGPIAPSAPSSKHWDVA